MIITLLEFILVFMHFFFLLAVWKRDFSLVDIAWGLGFILISLVSYIYHFNSIRNVVILLLVLCWGLRLSLYLLSRNWGSPEDHRYRELRESWQPHPNFHAWIKVFLFQGMLMLFISLPITAGMQQAGQELTWINKCGVIVFFLGWFLESYADRYLKRFKANPTNTGKICMSGPWRLCRFPNYLGEIILWYGIYLVCFSPSTWWTIIGPLALNLIIIKISGVPLHEKRYRNRAEYREYASRVPRLIPFTTPSSLKD